MTPAEIRLRFPGWRVFDDGGTPTAWRPRTSPPLRIVRADWDALATEMGRAEVIGPGAWAREEMVYREAQHREG
jgi:hypothetical protein